MCYLHLLRLPTEACGHGFKYLVAISSSLTSGMDILSQNLIGVK